MSDKNLQPIYIVGATATGKSELALKLAKKLDGIIISADSMQIYKGLDIGTAKVSKDVMRDVPHKMIDVVDVDAEFSVAEYARLARKDIESAISAGKLPIVVGGTGLYFEALIYPMNFAGTLKNNELRDYLTYFCTFNGAQALHDMLEFFDEESANRLNVNDVKRVIRALEIVLSTGKPMSKSGDKMYKTPQDVTMIGLTCDRELLYKRINERVDKMFEMGLADEVLSVGNFEYQSMQAIGYKEFKQLQFDIVDGKKQPNSGSLEEIKQLIKQHTRNYAKRQITWFKRYNFIKWFDVSDIDGALEYAENIVYNKI